MTIFKMIWPIAVLMIWCTEPAAGQQTIIPLYKGKAPGSEKWNWKEVQTEKSAWGPSIAYNVTSPTLTVYLPEAGKSTGAAIVLAPGGAFFQLSVEEEGRDVAKWLNSLGITVFMLKYRLAHTKGDNPMAGIFSLLSKDNAEAWQNFNEAGRLATLDGLNAMEYVRRHAGEYQLDSGKLGMLGFSAGGAVTLSVLYKAEEKNRPDFAGAIYSSDISPEETEAPQYKVPIFLAVASDDSFNLVPVSIAAYQKWQMAKQSAELHIYEKGGHGFALKKQDLPSDAWAAAFEKWLRFNKIIP